MKQWIVICLMAFFYFGWWETEAPPVHWWDEEEIDEMAPWIEFDLINKV